MSATVSLSPPQSRRMVRLRWLMISVFVLGIVSMIPGLPRMSSPELVIIPFIAYGVLGVRITHALPANPIGWTFLFVGMMTGLAGLAGTLTDRALLVDDVTSWWAVLGAWINGWFWYPLFMAATTFTFLLFPTGLPSRRWRPVAWLAVIVTAGFTLSGAFEPVLQFGDDASGPTTSNPLAAHLPASVTSALDVSESIGGPIILVLLVVSIAAPFVRYRRGTTVEREQLRWFLSGAVLLVLYVPGAELLLPSSDVWLNNASFAIIITLFPVSCGIAILRYRLFEIDRIISRTASYALVTASVLAVYAVVVAAITRLLPDTSSSLAVAAATLCAAAVARPLLHRVQRAVERRFNRSRYDAARTVDSFGGRLRNEVDAEVLQQDLVEVVIGTLEPREVGLWLRP